jgi:hypothetical protein
VIYSMLALWLSRRRNCRYGQVAVADATFTLDRPAPSRACPIMKQVSRRGSADRYGNPASADRQDRLVESAIGSVVGRDIARESRATAR